MAMAGMEIWIEMCMPDNVVHVYVSFQFTFSKVLLHVIKVSIYLNHSRFILLLNSLRMTYDMLVSQIHTVLFG